jgi:hypothetical protein
VHAFCFAVVVTTSIFGIRQMFRTFREQMADDSKVWFVGICGMIMAFCLITKYLV